MTKPSEEERIDEAAAQAVGGSVETIFRAGIAYAREKLIPEAERRAFAAARERGGKVRSAMDDPSILSFNSYDDWKARGK